jgi:hypothetical protein
MRFANGSKLKKSVAAERESWREFILFIEKALL